MPRSDPVDLLIVGAGPCGLAVAISAMRASLSVAVVDANVVVASIAQYPTYATFFSTAEKLSLGGVPFVIATEKPTRRDALAYYRTIVRHFAIPVHQNERVVSIGGRAGDFQVRTAREVSPRRAKGVVIATGYFGSPNLIGVPGEDLPHVTHLYHEGHEAFDQDVVVAGGGNSAAEAALDLWRCGARVTLAHFGPSFDKKIKPWVLPDFENRVKDGSIAVRWGTRITRIDSDAVTVSSGGTPSKLPAARVYLMTGFAPNVDLLRDMGVPIDATTGIPSHDPNTLETSIPGVFIAGVVVAGFDANKVFIENGRFHGDRIVARIVGGVIPPEPTLSAELDT